MNSNNNSDSIYCTHGPKNWQTSRVGELASQRLAVKDLFVIKGEKNSAGNPDWYKTHSASTITAPAITQLMQAGCLFTGFTHTDELAYSLEGNNIHYGIAENPKLQGHVCGGSTMGSAAAVAGGFAAHPARKLLRQQITAISYQSLTVGIHRSVKREGLVGRGGRVSVG